jgi:hypothetical protein
MGTPGVPPSNIWQRIVDSPLVQDANYRFNRNDRSYLDSQILGIEALLLASISGNLFTVYSQDCSAGGTITSGGTAGVGVIELIGTPAAAFTYVLPTGGGAYQVVNKTGKFATVKSYGSSTVVVANSAWTATDGTDVWASIQNPTVQRLNASSSSLQIVCTSLAQTVNLDTLSHGAFVGLMPAIVDAQIVRLVDLTSSGACNWGTVAGAVSVGAGVKIEKPTAPGTFTTAGTITFPSNNGEAYVYEGMASENVWKLVD